MTGYKYLRLMHDPKPNRWFITLILTVILIAALITFWANNVHAEEYTNNQIADAIYYAEGGSKAQFAYGIRSIPYSTIAEARQICLNTVKNNRVRFLKQSKYADFLEFLASRYCPVNCDNDKGTNKYWIKNVRYYLRKLSL